MCYPQILCSNGHIQRLTLLRTFVSCLVIKEVTTGSIQIMVQRSPTQLSGLAANIGEIETRSSYQAG